MIKKILTSILLILPFAVIFSQQLTISTTSNSNQWSPVEVLKSGDALTWTASNGIIGTISPVSQLDSDPVFDFSANNGSEITITVTSSDGFAGLSRLNLSDDEGLGAQITDVNLFDAINLDRLDVRFNELSDIDVSNNTSLSRLYVRNNLNLADLDVSANAQLIRLHLNRTNISTLDISNNPNINNLRVDRCQFETPELDQIIIQLDNFGLSNGIVRLGNNPGILSNASLAAYNNLIAKGWTIDVGPPPSPSLETIVLTTTSTSNAWSPFLIENAGSTLKWAVTGGVTIAEVEIDDPTFDLSGNTGVATITITSDFGFAGLTRLDFWNDNGIGSEITTLDVSNADQLERLNTRFNLLTTIVCS